MTKEKIIKIINEYNKNHDDNISITFHQKEYYVLVYTRYGKNIYSHSYYVFRSKEDRDRFILEEEYREYDGYRAEKITKKKLQGLGYDVTCPHIAFRRYVNDECILDYDEEFKRKLVL